jgi:RNA polymerase sigma-70 factor (ECF subfamily)
MAKLDLDLEELYAQRGEQLLLFLVRRTADPEIALDLWAESFAQAAAGRQRFRGSRHDEAAAWLFAIARRQLALYYRRGRVERRALHRLKLERPPAGQDVLLELSRRAQLDAVRVELAAALAELSPAIRHAVALRVVEEHSYPEVSNRLGISEAAARARVSRGLAALARQLEDNSAQEAVKP